uniref:Envelope protein n=1 Tax=Cyanoderma ruficeps TaxID=181631 RepID=A0A8C3QG78_9PASS
CTDSPTTTRFPAHRGESSTVLSYPSDSHHPYRPHVWTFKNFISGAVIGQLETNTPAWTVRLADIFTNDRSGKTSRDIAVQTYWCPSHNPAKKQCTRPGYWFCGHWGCETIVTGYRRWRPPREDVFLKVTGWPHDCVFGTKYQGRKIGTCTHLTITVLQPQDPSWAMGRLWSVYQHDDAPLIKDPDLGTVIQIIRAPTHKRHIAVDQAQNLFTRMLYAAFLSLNALQPNLTESCWLCYDSRPSFYEGIGSNRTFQYSQEASPKQCRWDTPSKGITLGIISGHGVCIGNKSTKPQNTELCKSPVKLDKQKEWAIPAPGNMWPCHTTGLTLVSLSNALMRLTIFVPKLLSSPGSCITQTTKSWRTGAATGITLLATQKQGLEQLQRTIDEGLLQIHRNILKLEESLFPLSEMVLQNRRGLDLLLMQQGGLCAALKEECCTYVNHSGPIRQSMTELKERLERRPVIVIILALLFGPCMLNKIAQFVKARLSKIEIMVLQQRQLT